MSVKEEIAVRTIIVRNIIDNMLYSRSLATELARV
jgi:hypothetical protein